MKTKYWLLLPLLIIPVFLFSCAGPPTLSKSPTTDTLSLSVNYVGTPTPVTGVGAFYDYSQPSTIINGSVTTINSYTSTPISIPGGPWSFSDYTHDTLGFSITITSSLSSPMTFNYQLDSISGGGVVTPPSNVFTSGRISF